MANKLKTELNDRQEVRLKYVPVESDLNDDTRHAVKLKYVPVETGEQNAGNVSLAQTSPATNQQYQQYQQSLAATASPATAGTSGTTLPGLSAGTQAGLSKYGQQYAPSQTVNEAKSYLDSVIADRPGEFSSKYAADIASLYDQIMNRPKFTYDVNKDPLFQQYKNQYTVQGQRAMQDTLGQAAALTGGYGNSWGTTAGYQAYQYYLQQLNDRVPELEQRAFDRYTAEGNEMRDNMNLATTLDSIDYNRYRDTVADWQADRDFANQMYSQEKSWDMNDWNSLRNYYTQLANLENSSYWTGENLKENARQFDADLAYKYYSTDLDEAFRRDDLAENARQFDADLAEKIRQADMSDKLQRDKLADEARRFDADLAEKIRQFDTTTAYNERAWQHGLEREAVEDARYADETAYNRSQDEIENALKQAAFDEGVRQFDLGYDLDKAEFDLKYQKYLDELAKLEGTGTGGGGGNGGNGGTDKEKDKEETETKTGIIPKVAGEMKSTGLVKDKEESSGSGFLTSITNRMKQQTQETAQKAATIMNTVSEEEKKKRNETTSVSQKSYQGLTQEQINITIKDIEKIFK